MKTDLVEIFQTVRANLQPYTANGFTATVNSDTEYELWADRGIDINGEKKDIVRFSSVKINDDHVELCITPLTEEADLQKVINPDLLALLSNGCFKLHQLDDDMVGKIADAFVIGYTSYKQKGWV